MKKTQIKRLVTINASKDKVWDALADFGNVSKLSPGVLKSYSTSEIKQGIGAERHCDFTAMGAQVEERVTGWKEGESINIDIYESKKIPMIRNMKAYFHLEAKGDQTLLSGSFEYNMNHALGNMLNSMKMKSMNEKSWVSFLAGIKHHVETGENVPAKMQVDTSAVTG